jgi:carboxyl-terminal processing protease
MTVRQPAEKDVRTLTMVRSEVPFETVQGFRRQADDTWTYRIDPAKPVGYVWIKSIKSSTLHELREVERKLKADGIRSLIIDLRSSASMDDLLQHAALAADGLLDSGVLWRLRDKQNQVTEINADPECLFRAWPLAVLVNSETRSVCQAALAAALQDQGRAFLVGEPPRCDGFVTSRVNLPDDQGALFLRTARLERASGSAWPVRPDAPVALNPRQHDLIREWLRKKDLPAGSADEPPADPQLQKAIDLLLTKVPDARN